MIDFSKLKPSRLARLAETGDTAAKAELKKREATRPADLDVTKMSSRELRQLVHDWRKGATPEDLQRSFDLANRAYVELDVRRVVDERAGREVAPLPFPEWLLPKPRRCVGWKRPMGSKLYPSDEDLARAELAAITSKVYAERNSAR